MRRTSKQGISAKSEKRSGLEDATIAYLNAEGVDFKYEAHLIPYVAKPKTYLPDFVLPNGIVIETKGQFDSEDRTKMKLVKKQNPDLDIRFVFSRGATYLTTQRVKEMREWIRSTGHTGPINHTMIAALRDDFRAYLKAKGERLPSSTTYGDWADTHGFPWANKLPPKSWLHEPPNEASLTALERMTK